VFRFREIFLGQHLPWLQEQWTAAPLYYYVLKRDRRIEHTNLREVDA
jgi:hypothetical protein